MSENYEHREYFDFSGGVNLAVSRLLMADNECIKIHNGELEKIGAISKVKGYSQRGSDVNDGYSILGAMSGYKADGTMKQIVIANDAEESDAYTYNTVTNSWTPHQLSLTAGAKAEFEYFLDGWFMANYSDATRFNDFTQWYTTTNVTNAAKAKYIKLYKSRIYLAYVVSGGSTYPSKVTYSDLPSSGTIAWDDSVNYFDVDTDDSDVTMGLEVNADRLLIFKENSLYRYDTNTLFKVPGCPGTVSQRSVANIQGWTLYLHSSGIWGYNGKTSTNLSRRITDIINGISSKNLGNSCAWSTGDHYYLYVGDINNSDKGIEIDKCLIDYDISKNSFTWRSLEHEPTVFTNYRDDRSAITYNISTVSYNDSDTTYNGLISAEDRVYFGDNDGAVYHFNVGKDHAGTDISFMVETKDYYLDVPSMYKLLHKIIVYVDKGKAITFQYKLDDKNWKTLGKINKEQTELTFPSASRCQKVRFRVIEKSDSGRFAFEGFDIYFNYEGLIQ